MGQQWSGSDRKARLPADWEQRRATIRDRAGGRCQATMRDGTRCIEPGTDCDNIVHGDDHSPTNLQWLCRWHHNRKIALEALEARRFTRVPSARKPRETHPGLR
jgi:5-methylcytosine-specific restriction protein A